MNFQHTLNSYYIDPKHLSLYRLLYCFIVMFIIGLPSYSWIANSLNYLFNPPALSFAALFDQFPESGFFITLTALNLCLFMLMFLGIATKWTSLLFSITCIVGHNFWYSFGKIDHLLLWYLAPAFLGFAGWGRYFSLNVFRKYDIQRDVSINTNSMIILCLALSIGFSMFTSSVEKIAGGWLTWDGEGVRYHLLRNFLTLNRHNLLTYPLIDYKNHFFWKVLDYSAVIMEFTFLLSVVRITYFRFLLAIGVVFHVLVLLTFNIPFYSNLIVYLIFIDWSLLYKKWNIRSIFDNKRNGILVVRTMIVISISFTFSWLIYLSQNTYFFTFPGLLQTLFSYLPFSNPFETSLFTFFLLVFLFTLYMVYCHIEQHLKTRAKKN